ncbi:hypothetical protein Solca_1598 [Sporocytophaga myxococcoides]|uniref:Uncharacterized protein n=1 Tax=Sporocytophaga myxococcoides TaxID=153721 RepID=A0A098LGR6_9BACT|nr:hypothetical protein Solca_1598 [Sporocytophaga myxococcoides]
MIRNTQSGINYLLADNGDIGLNEERLLDLYGKGEDSIALKRMNWGIFDLAAVRAFSNKREIYKVVEFGYKPDGESKCAIYLSNYYHPLYIGGKSIVKGTSYLPDRGARRPSESQFVFTGTQLIQGEVKKSGNKLPDLNKEIKDRVLSFLDGNFSEDEFEKNQTIETDTLKRSFIEKTILLSQKGTLSIKNVSGNVIIKSDTLFRIPKDCFLKDIVIIARAIEIESGFNGSLQIFGADSIILNENVTLNYPSVVGVFQRDFKTAKPFIKIKNRCRINGIVFSSQSGLDLQKMPAHNSEQTLIILEKEAYLHGQLYADGFANIQGVVHGAVLCNKFYHKGSNSENYLIDATIDATKLSTNFIGSSLLTSEKKKRLIKWME